MEQNEQSSGESTNPIVLYILLGTIALAVLAMLYKAFF